MVILLIWIELQQKEKYIGNVANTMERHDVGSE